MYEGMATALILGAVAHIIELGGIAPRSEQRGEGESSD